MFVPSTLLLWCVALGLCPLALLAGLAGFPLEQIALVAAIVGLLVAMDAVLSLSRLRHVSLSLPATVRCSKGKRCTLAISVTDASQSLTQLKLGLPFPAALEPDTAELEINLAAGTPSLKQWPVLALERGSYLIQRAYLQTSSMFGLWEMRQSMDCHCEIRVYPDLSREKQALAPLFFRRGTMGTHRVRQLGRGREFEQLRAYLPGDSYSDIYWKGTAKRQFPVTMMYQVERTQELHVLIDISRRSARQLEKPIISAVPKEEASIAPQTQCERFIQAAMVLALSADQQGDRCGIMTFSDQVHSIVPAGAGKAHYNAIRDSLYMLEPRVVSPDFAELFVQVGNRIRQRSLLIILTDLAEPWLSESFQEAVAGAAKKHVIIVHTLGSKEFQPLFQRGDSIQQADDLYPRLAGHLMWRELQDTTRELKQCGVHLTSSLEEGLIADAVNAYLNVKKRQLI
jgi:uncharacterized protein (DUF58 family)